MSGHVSISPRIDGRLIVSQMMHRVYVNLDSAQKTVAGAWTYGNRWKSEEIIYFLDAAYQHYMEILRKSCEGETEKSIVYSIVGGQEEYALPSDFMKARYLLYKAGTGTWVPLGYRYDFDTAIITEGSAVGGASFDYHFREMCFALNPVPISSESGALKLQYQSIVPALTDEGHMTVTEFLPQWQELLVLYATVRGRAKDAGDAGLYKELLAKHEQSFREYLENRSMARSVVQPFGDSEGDESWIWTGGGY